jgi:seryl-tRNA synthetase
MKHLAVIQSEFLKSARKWDDMSQADQKAYLKRHPKSKRKITGKTLSDLQHKKREMSTADIDAEIKQLEAKKKELESQTPEQKKKLKKLTDLSSQFKKDKFEVNEEFDNNIFSVTNKKGFSMSFKLMPKGNFEAIVEGYSRDINLGDVGKTYKDLKEIATAINKSWMKENEPGIWD